MKPAREPASSRPKPCTSLKKPHESCPFAAPCGPPRKKNDRGQTSAFPSETSRLTPLILAHRGSALPWLVDEPASSRPKPCTSLKKPHESCPFAAPCGPRRKKNDRGQTSAFPLEISRLTPLILALRGSALPWLVDDRASLRLRRIWCVPTR